MTAIDIVDLERRIVERAGDCGVTLPEGAAARLATHVRLVLRDNERLHLTTIVEPYELLERHLGESFEGAALLPGDVRGTLLDLGSGNGYPGVPIAAVRPGLRPVLTEASRRKAEFLREVLAIDATSGEVFEGQVQRAPDLRGLTAEVVTTRAMGAWQKIVPRMHAALAPDAHVLVWATADAEPIFQRTVWRRFEIRGRRDLPDREACTIWHLRPIAR